jgi:hypothetical protein
MKRRKTGAVQTFRPEAILVTSVGTQRYLAEEIEAIARTAPSANLSASLTISLPSWWRRERPEQITTSVLEGVRERLEIAAALYFRDDMWTKQPTPAELTVKFNEIKDHAKTLLAALGLGTKSHSDPSLLPYSVLSRLSIHAGGGMDAAQRVRTAAAQVKNLHDWAERELWAAKARPKAKFEFVGDEAFNDFLRELADIWTTLLSGKARVSAIGGNSSRKGQACGPFFEFMKACLAPLDVEPRLKTPARLGARLRRLFNKKKAKA